MKATLRKACYVSLSLIMAAAMCFGMTSLSWADTPAGETAAGYTVTFDKDEGVDSIDIYHTHDYDTVGETNVTSALTRDKDSGEVTTAEGQVNFKINLKDGYTIQSVTATEGTYNNLKDHSDSTHVNFWRITKVTANTTVKITTANSSAEKPGTGETATEYTGTFDADEGVASIDVYNTQDYTKASETAVTTAIARNSDTGEADVSGDGQINFKVNLKDGYTVKSIAATEGAYKNIKDNSTDPEGIPENIYRITKITGDLTITVTTTSAAEYTGTFDADEGVASIDVYNTQDYTKASETAVTTAIARNADTGEADVSGDGQINFKVNLKDGYTVKSIAATEGAYKNIKDNSTDPEKIPENIYRITKITGDLTITVTTEKTAVDTPVNTDISTLNIAEISDSTYTGKAITPDVVITDGEKILVEGTDFEAAYTGNKAVGTATVTITGQSSYTGTITKTFKINPKGTNVKKLSKAKKAFTVKWKKQAAKMNTSRITGYEIHYSTDASMTNAKTVKVKGYSKTSKKIKKLAKKTKYYVQIRTYKSVNGTTYYSNWSAVKTVKTK